MDEDLKTKPGMARRVWRFYRDGFASMTVGRTLWVIVGIKLVVFFLIIKWLFFPDFLSAQSDSDEGKAEYVRGRLAPREATPLSSEQIFNFKYLNCL